MKDTHDSKQIPPTKHDMESWIANLETNTMTPLKSLAGILVLMKLMMS